MMKSPELEAKHLRWIEACTSKRDMERVMYDISNDQEDTSVRRKLSRRDCTMLVNKLWQIADAEAQREQAEQVGVWKAAAGWLKTLAGCRA